MSAQDLRPSTLADYRGWNDFIPEAKVYSVQLNFTGTVAGSFNVGNPTAAGAMPSIARAVTVHTASDTIKLLRLPANCVYEVYAQLVTAQGATCTVGVATDEGTPTTIDSAFDLNGTPGKIVGLNASTPGVATVFRTGTADCNIVLTLGNTTNAAVVNFVVRVQSLIPRIPA